MDTAVDVTVAQPEFPAFQFPRGRVSAVGMLIAAVVTAGVTVVTCCVTLLVMLTKAQIGGALPAVVTISARMRVCALPAGSNGSSATCVYAGAMGDALETPERPLRRVTVRESSNSPVASSRNV